MFILITDDKGNDHIVKDTDIKRVTVSMSRTTVRFANRKENESLFVKETVSDFFAKYLKPKVK